MLILLPLPDRPTGRWPWLSVVVLSLLVLLQVAEAAIHLLPASAQYVVSKLAWLRLYTHPDEVRGLFRSWQLWSQALLCEGWLALVLHGVAWSWLAPAAEARLGSLGLLMGLAVLLPLAGGTLLLGGVASPHLGPVSLILAAGALLLGAESRVRLRGIVLWWLLATVGSARFAVPASAVLIAAVLLDIVLRWNAGVLLADPSPRYLPVLLLGLVLTVVAGQLLPRLLLPVRSVAGAR